MPIPFLEQNADPVHILNISTHTDDTLKALTEKTPQGAKAKLYTISQDTLLENMEVRYGPDHVYGQHANAGPPIGRAHFHFISSKMELNVHGRDFLMKRKSPIGGHYFTYPGVNEMQWKSNSLVSSGLKLLDSQGRMIACTKKSMMGTVLGGGPSAIHIFDRINDGFLMDLIVVTGLAAIEYRRQSDEGWNWLKEASG